MGKILLIGSNKGGGGKSMTSANLGVGLHKRGYSVCLVDADKQRTLDKWQGYRKEEDIEPFMFCITKRGKISKELIAIRDNYDFIIVDVEGSNSVELIQSMAVADVCIAPHQATQQDLETLTEMQSQLDIILPANPSLKVLAYQTKGHSNPATFKTERDGFLSMLEQHEDITPTHAIGYSRVCYYSHWSEGRSVFDLPKNKATLEINTLIDEVMTCLDLN